jgi:5-methylcytosine-specific restriction endonuclease McrA
MEQIAMKACSSCGEAKPINRENFGSTPSGGFRNKCRKCVAAYSKEYSKTHSRIERDERRRSLVKNNYSDDQKRALIKKYHDICPCCLELIVSFSDCQLDHKIPLSRGGADTLENIIPVHRQCNLEKHNKTLLEHWDWRLNNGLDTVDRRDIIRDVFKRRREDLRLEESKK